jgi:hypothetical protein
MKKYSFLFYITFITMVFTSCIKEDVKTFTGDSVVEFDAAVFNPTTSGFTYPILTRHAGFGRPVVSTTSIHYPTVDPVINRSIGTVKLRVNLVGPHRATDEVLQYRVMTDVTPTSPNALAVSGTHFTTSGSVTIPAGSSFGEITITVINPGAASSTPREVHLELLGNENIKPSENYKKVAIRISQS